MADRVDWFRIYADLKKSEWSLCRVSRETGIARTTMASWRDGVEPKHADGEAIIEVWEKVTGKCRKDVPVQRRYPSGHFFRK